MINNRYFIIDLTIENMMSMIDKIVGNFQDQRTSLDNTLVLIKLPDGDENNYTELAGYTEYNHEQILAIMQTPAWSNSII